VTLIYVSHSQPPAGAPLTNVGGMQRVAEELLDTLLERDDVDVQPIVLRSSWKWIHIKVFPFLLTTFLTLRSRIKKGEVETILFSSMVTALLIIPLRPHLVRNRVKTAAIVHGLDITTPSAVYQRMVRKIFQLVDVVLPVSGAAGAQCTARGLDPDRVRVVYNGVDVARFEPEPPAVADRAGLYAEFDLDPTALPQGALLICSVGRQVKRKGYAWFVENVMPLLPDNVHYWLGGDGPEREDILSTIERCGLQDRVRLLGMLSDPQLNALYRGSDLFVMPNIKVPNDMEGFGIVMLEAGMNGLPSIGARLEGVAEVIKDGHNGFLVETEDVEGFATRIGSYASGETDLVAARQKAFDYTRSTYAWETIARRVTDGMADVKRR
jgi:phosphatidylinositol alpha-1,6-mannosyltransferase